MKVVIKEIYHEEIIAIGTRFIEIIVNLEGKKRKDELILLLHKLNELHKEINNKYSEYANKLEEKKKDVTIATIPFIIPQMVDETNGCNYLWGKISTLKSIINAYLQKIIDSETNLTEEEQQEIIKQSKDDKDLNYIN